MYFRLVTSTTDADSQRRLGVFHPAYDLYRALRDRSPDHHDVQALKELLVWFEENLDTPSRLRSRRCGQTKTAICWFKDSAKGHIQRLFEVRRILQDNGITSEIVNTDRPGVVLYEDAYQIAAIPFADSDA